MKNDILTTQRYILHYGDDEERYAAVETAASAEEAIRNLRTTWDNANAYVVTHAERILEVEDVTFEATAVAFDLNTAMENLLQCGDGGYKVVVSKIELLEKLNPTVEQILVARKELDEGLIKRLSDGLRYAADDKELFALLDNRLALHCYEIERPRKAADVAHPEAVVPVLTAGSETIGIGVPTEEATLDNALHGTSYTVTDYKDDEDNEEEDPEGDGE